MQLTLNYSRISWLSFGRENLVGVRTWVCGGVKACACAYPPALSPSYKYLGGTDLDLHLPSPRRTNRTLFTIITLKFS
jgi:hypothetical protein